MKIGMNVDADSISVLALNMGRIAVEIEGIELAELIDAVNSNGCSLCIADEPGHVIVGSPHSPTVTFKGIQCSTAHITDDDNALLYTVSHQREGDAEAEWIAFTGTGYLLRLNAWQYPSLRLKRLGLSKACRRLVIALMQRQGISLLHLDAAGDVLPGFVTFAW